MASPSKDKLRLSKLMSEREICSRREADLLIKKKLVLVDGEIAVLGLKVDPDAKIELRPRAKRYLNHKITVVINKPLGIVSSQPEDGYKAAVELVTMENLDERYYVTQKSKWSPNITKQLAPAGRLDINSKGLLVLTQDGVLAKKLIGSTTVVEKEYFVQVKENMTSEQVQKLSSGLKLDGELLKDSKVTPVDENSFYIVLLQGKKRQIRRMCELVGLNVTHLKRIRMGRLKLGDLKEGCWRFLEPHEKV